MSKKNATSSFVPPRCPKCQSVEGVNEYIAYMQNDIVELRAMVRGCAAQTSGLMRAAFGGVDKKLIRMERLCGKMQGCGEGDDLSYLA